MKDLCVIAMLMMVITGCARQPSLPADSKFNVTSVLNDSTWFGTGRAIKLQEAGHKMEDVRTFNLFVATDIDYPEMGGGPNPNTDNGCTGPECTRTQTLVFYNIPLKKGRYNIAKLNKRSRLKNEYASLSYIGNAGGLLNLYVYNGLKPGWIRVTKYDKTAGIVEGRFAVSLSQDTRLTLPLRGRMPATAHFTDGLFRLKVTDIVLK